MGLTAFDRLVPPGYTGDGDDAAAHLLVYELTTGVALGETLLPALDPANTTTPAMWVEMAADDGAGNAVGVYVIANRVQIPLLPPAALPAPNPVEFITGGNPDQSCVFIPPGRPWMRKWLLGQSFNAIQVSGADAYLRCEITSPAGL